MAKHAHASRLDITLGAGRPAYGCWSGTTAPGIAESAVAAGRATSGWPCCGGGPDLGGTLDLRTEDGAVVTIQLPPS